MSPDKLIIIIIGVFEFFVDNWEIIKTCQLNTLPLK